MSLRDEAGGHEVFVENPLFCAGKLFQLLVAYDSALILERLQSKFAEYVDNAAPFKVRRPDRIHLVLAVPFNESV